jgi:hypothetical protein
MKAEIQVFRRMVSLAVLGGFCAPAFGKLPSREVTISPYLSKPGIEKTSSFCYVNRDSEVIEGQNIKQKVRIASVSKLFTTYYVLKSMGPQFRFKTHFYFDTNRKDLYVFGSKDPFMGARALSYIVSELNRLGIKDVRNLYFDDKFAVYFDVEQSGPLMWADTKMPGEVRYEGRSSAATKADLRRFLMGFKRLYPTVKAEAAAAGIKMMDSPRLTVKNIELIAAGSLTQKPSGIGYEYVSSPLINYVKSLNTHSNNYVADELIAASGGIDNMVQFLSQDLGFTNDDFEFYTGSGLWKNVPRVQGSDRTRTANSKDNLASCETVMNVLFSLERLLKKYNMEMADALMVASEDRGSLTLYKVYRSEELSDSVIAKTGTLNSAATLAGEISAKSGDYLFGIFFQTRDRTATSKATVYRDLLVRQLMENVGKGKDPIEYKPLLFSPFDKNSSLREISEASSGGHLG